MNMVSNISTVEVGDIGKTLEETFSVRGKRESGGELFEERQRGQFRFRRMTDILVMNAGLAAVPLFPRTLPAGLRFGNLISESPITIALSCLRSV